MALLRWPLPALLSWALAWLAFAGLRQAGLSPLIALTGATLLGVALSLLHAARWRRLIVAAGFPVSLLAGQGGSALPAWAWLAPLALLILVYPRRSWHDAPLFPTPTGALAGVGALADLPADARVLDVGCGLGHGLRELHRAYPAARIEGIEWSGLLAWLARRRCPWAQIARGDMWAQDWSPFELVYVFQRPETMAGLWVKAQRELRPGAWLLSLDFAVPGQPPQAMLDLPQGHSLWLYRLAGAGKAEKTDLMHGSDAAAAPHTQESALRADMGKDTF
ncbi:MAG: class I SAM-dependent methyltransferase [Burkholderiaceae bacterium]